ncbi:putative protein phosphatase 2C 24 [Brachypodium distachyon]|uniref:Protein phosphatase n=1 Tax=Brachypodium distachyon TaxID=15368 RepID=I1GXJ8_BRADI|nr:putative protein phosphatase 2C 24 [Brachypodium distachyon]KQK17775.1 hypothetical protein BRADI_1g36690v3 [Brachypodium distachyon]|eukprot:XP_003560608.1 putative protein phosphatase 2C 24 [Brachypodium distachyon]
MDSLPQIRQTLEKIRARTPEPLRLAFRIHFGSLPASAAGARQDVARYLAALSNMYEPEDLMEFDEVPLKMEFASCYLPDHDEDAHFAHAEPGVIGVADGVGGCRGKGMDAAAFSRKIMENARAEVESCVPGTHICPCGLLERSYLRAVAARTPAASTAIILSLTGRFLKWAYVGDSGFAVFRRGKIIQRSQPQQNYFNCPYQLRSEGGNKISDAAVGEVRVKAGDVVVVGSDGLFDNVFDSGLERIVQMGAAVKLPPDLLANVIAEEAYVKARSSGDSPFSVSCREQTGTSCRGGKEDDITVVVAYILE